MVRTRTDSYLGRVWIIADPGDHEPIPGTPYPDFVTKLLRRRGIETAAEALEYLFDTPPTATSAFQLPDAEAALDRIERAVRTDESIAVYGDFDVDGITSTAILTEAIRAVGGRVTPFIPDRFTDGYGIHKKRPAQFAPAAQRNAYHHRRLRHLGVRRSGLRQRPRPGRRDYRSSQHPRPRYPTPTLP